MKKMDEQFTEHFDSMMELLVSAKHAFEEGDSQKAVEMLNLVIGGCKLQKELCDDK